MLSSRLLRSVKPADRELGLIGEAYKAALPPLRRPALRGMRARLPVQARCGRPSLRPRLGAMNVLRLALLFAAAASTAARESGVGQVQVQVRWGVGAAHRRRRYLAERWLTCLLPPPPCSFPIDWCSRRPEPGANPPVHPVCGELAAHAGSGQSAGARYWKVCHSI